MGHITSAFTGKFFIQRQRCFICFYVVMFYLCTKIGVRSLISSKLIEGCQVLELGHLTLTTPTLRVIYHAIANAHTGRWIEFDDMCIRFDTIPECDGRTTAQCELF